MWLFSLDLKGKMGNGYRHYANENAKISIDDIANLYFLNYLSNYVTPQIHLTSVGNRFPLPMRISHSANQFEVNA